MPIDHKGYETPLVGSLGVGINRRRITPVSAPAVTRYVAIWLPATRPRSDEWEAYKEPAERLDLVDDLIAAVYRNIEARSTLIAGFDTNSWTGPERTQIALFGSILRVDQPFDRIESQGVATQRTIKFFITLGSVSISIAFSLHAEMATITTIVNCASKTLSHHSDRLVLNVLEEAFSKVARFAQWTDEEAGHASHALYERAWQLIDEQLFPDDCIRKLGWMILDSRGVVLQSLASGFRRKSVLTPPFAQAEQAGLSSPARLTEPPTAIDIDTVSKVLPLLSSQSAAAVEYTLSWLMGGRAVFSSCLGSGPDRIDTDKPAPVTFLLIVGAYNSWQLGRLLYRIHRAGSARVAATIYFAALRSLAAKLRRVELRLEDALSKASMSTSTDDENLSSAKTEARDAYSYVERDLDGILRYGAEEPINYRVERSRYYVRLFRRSAKAMRIDRFEGFQPYDEFVEQRQGSAFELIDLLGRRYERVQNDRNLLLRRIQVFSAQYNENEIRKAQLSADLALFIVLGPYYLGQISMHVAEARIGGEHTHLAHIIWTGWLLAGIGYFTVRRRSWAKFRKSKAADEQLTANLRHFKIKTPLFSIAIMPRRRLRTNQRGPSHSKASISLAISLACLLVFCLYIFLFELPAPACTGECGEPAGTKATGGAGQQGIGSAASSSSLTYRGVLLNAGR